PGSEVNLYISDNNDRVQLWLAGTSSSTTVAGGNGRGSSPFQLNRPFANYIFDHYLFVADHDNARIQRFDLNASNINTQFNAAKPGNYSVIATFNNSCVATSNNIQVTDEDVELSAVSSADVADVMATNEHSTAFVYPNPARNTVTINFSARQNNKYMLEL